MNAFISDMPNHKQHGVREKKNRFLLLLPLKHRVNAEELKKAARMSY